MSTSSRTPSGAPSSQPAKRLSHIGKGRAKSPWTPLETRRAIVLVANGYHTSDVARHLGRYAPPTGSAPCIQGLMQQLGTSVGALRRQRALTTREKLLRPPLPPFDPSVLTRPVEEDFPGISLFPPSGNRTFDEEEIGDGA